MDIATFLTDRLDAQERTAYSSEFQCFCEWCGHAAGVHVCERHRRLADVAAKRAILSVHSAGSGNQPFPTCGVCVDWNEQPTCEPPPMDRAPCATVRLLAASYIDHADFDPAWRVVTADAG